LPPAVPVEIRLRHAYRGAGSRRDPEHELPKLDRGQLRRGGHDYPGDGRPGLGCGRHDPAHGRAGAAHRSGLSAVSSAGNRGLSGHRHENEEAMVSVIIAAYNEATTVGQVISEVKGHPQISE